jgi:hypothetical protein
MTTYRTELERAIPRALEAAEADARTFFDIEIPAIQEFWGTFSREQAARIHFPGYQAEAGGRKSYGF